MPTLNPFHRTTGVAGFLSLALLLAVHGAPIQASDVPQAPARSSPCFIE